MDICAATIFCSPNHTPIHLIKWIESARTVFHLPVSKLQLATTPFAEWLPFDNKGASYAAKYEQIWLDRGIDALCFGTLKIRRDDEWLDKLIDIIGGTKQSYFNVELVNDSGFVDIGRINAISRTVKTLSDQSPQALQRLTTTAHCPPGAPWQQAATSNGLLSFSLALDISDLVLQTFQHAVTQVVAEQTLITALECTVQKTLTEATTLSTRSGIPFNGFDFMFTLPHGVGISQADIWAAINQVAYRHYAGVRQRFGRKQLPHPHHMSRTELNAQYNTLAAQAAITRTPLMIQHSQRHTHLQNHPSEPINSTQQ